MTDRVCGFIVTLKDNIREDDIRELQEALGWFKHVLSVDPVVADPGQIIAEARVRQDMLQRFYAFYCSLEKVA
jgi:hypothetical protein